MPFVTLLNWSKNKFCFFNHAFPSEKKRLKHEGHPGIDLLGINVRMALKNEHLSEKTKFSMASCVQILIILNFY